MITFAFIFLLLIIGLQSGLITLLIKQKKQGTTAKIKYNKNNSVHHNIKVQVPIVYNDYISTVSREILINKIIIYASETLGKKNLVDSVEWIISQKNEDKNPGFYKSRSEYNSKALIILYETYNNEIQKLINTILHLLYYHYRTQTDIENFKLSYKEFYTIDNDDEIEYETAAQSFADNNCEACLNYLIRKKMVVLIDKFRYN